MVVARKSESSVRNVEPSGISTCRCTLLRLNWQENRLPVKPLPNTADS